MWFSFLCYFILYFFNCSPENFDVDHVKESFNKLVNGRFVERCPAPEPFLAPPSDEETPAKKRGAKSTKVVMFTFQPCVSFIILFTLYLNQYSKVEGLDVCFTFSFVCPSF